ncbi:MAG: phosphoglycerate kinase [Deltaproteobacteria bacterium]|nr:MAG: phosphoglycerate kinase [Deltaproteobacteria bacterium]
MKIRTVDQMDLSGKRTLIRVDFNVPMDKAGNVTDDTRIQAALPTIRLAVEKGAKTILLSHMGRPKGKRVPEMSLAPVAPRLEKLLGRTVAFAPDCAGEVAEKAVAAMKPGDVLLLENVRYYAEEEKNDEGFGKKLAALCDVYVNDAFATAHRGHASNVAILKFVKERAAGMLMKDEIAYFEKALVSPARPLVAVFGGAKISGKIQAINNVLGKVDKILIGGAMANTFFAALGYGVGKSLHEADMVETARQVLAGAAGKKVRLYLPVDVVVADRLDASAQTKTVPAQEIPDGMMALDIGPASGLLFREALQDAKTIVWNGPMGAFETAPFAAGTQSVMRALAESDATTIVGGGDTDTALHKAGLFSRMSYVSTGGGAFLELLEGKRLPGIAALEEE